MLGRLAKKLVKYATQFFKKIFFRGKDKEDMPPDDYYPLF